MASMTSLLTTALVTSVTSVRALANAPGEKLDRKAAAGAAGQSDPGEPDGTFKRAWKSIKDDGYADAVGNSRQLTDKGRDKAEGLGVAI